MELDYVIHPDKNSVDSFALGKYDNIKACNEGNKQLYDFLIDRGKHVFVITPETEKHVVKKINSAPINRRNKAECLDRLYALKEIMDIRSVDPSKHERVKADVRKFFEEFASKKPSFIRSNGINLENVSPMFRDTVRRAVFNNCEKSYFKIQEEEDVEIFSGMLLNMDKDKTNFLISSDYHFVGSGIKKAIEDTYGFVVDFPKDLLSKIGGQDIYLPASAKYSLCK